MKSFRIQFSILISFLLVLILTCGAIIFYNFNRTTTILFQKVDNEIHYVSENLQRATRDYLSPAKWLTQLIALETKHDSTLMMNKRIIIDLSLNMLSLFPQISGFYFGDPQGNFLAVRLLLPNSFYPDQPGQLLPSQAYYEVREIDCTNDINYETFSYLDVLGKQVAHARGLKSNNNFDPRTRPWYQGAQDTQQLYWSDPYIFQLSKQVGITAAVPILDQNQHLKMVLSADITMAEISKLLRENPISPSSMSAIITKSGYLIGYPDLDKLKKNNTADNVELLKISDTQNPAVIQAYRHYQQTGQTKFEFKNNDQIYIARLLPFGHEFNKDWLILFIALQNDFINDAQKITQAMVMISFIIVLIATLLIFIIARSIARPIERVAGELDSIKDLDIDIVKPVHSRFHEINLMNNALVSMKISLRNFGKFVPKDVVRKLIASGEGASLGGKRMMITTLFSDIKGFSSISEKMTSEDLALHLSDYFDELTQIILKEQGTIDKYIGDSIMAFWGAPLECVNHGELACLATLTCMDKLQELNDKWLAEGKPQFLTRFGIHSGDAVVGNVGSRDRLNYSAFGDNVNIASRLEGANKAYGIYCLISESTYQLAKDKFICRLIDNVNVVGKSQGLKVYQLLAQNIGDNQSLLNLRDLTEQAYTHYSERKFTTALSCYQAILTKYPQDTVAQIFIDRIKEYMDHPPSTEWCAIHNFTSK